MRIISSSSGVLPLSSLSPTFVRSVKMGLNPIVDYPFAKKLLVVDSMLRTEYPMLGLLARRRAAEALLRSLDRSGSRSRSRRRSRSKSRRRSKSGKRKRSRRGRRKSK